MPWCSADAFAVEHHVGFSALGAIFLAPEEGNIKHGLIGVRQERERDSEIYHPAGQEHIQTLLPSSAGPTRVNESS